MTRALCLFALGAAGLVSGCTTVRLGPDAAGAPVQDVSAGDVSSGTRLFPARLGDKWGYVDASGAVAIAPRFDDAQSFSEGRAGVRVGLLWGYVGPTGAFVAEPAYASVFP
ncbi:MAG TPA: WG repeat-containing protein, partial [Rubricoccaceae bacterium]